jgi:hypothetical protein
MQFDGGDTNLYAYAGSDPVNHMDRGGLEFSGGGGEPGGGGASGTYSPPDSSPDPCGTDTSGKPWKCSASCNLEGTEPQCTGRVTGSGSGSSEADACRSAKREATQSAPRGCYARHCQCDCSQ